MSGDDKSTSAVAAATTSTTNWAVLGSMNGQDIEAIAFLVLMQAAKSAQEDLKAIMASVKAINQAKAKQREAVTCAQRKLAAMAAFTIASKLRPEAILAAPAYSLDAARELCRWLEFVVQTDGGD
jgi:hypothetical protein